MTSLPDSAASLAAIATTPSAPRWPRKRRPHRVQLAEPAHVALAPGGDAVAQPMLFAHDLAAELVLLALLLLEDRVAPGFEMRKTLVEPARVAAVEPHGCPRDALQEAAVVRDDDDCRRRAVQLVFQPLDRGEIEMVGRLIEQQDVGLRGDRAGKGGAARLAAGKLGRLFLAGQPEMVEQIGGAMRIVGRAETRLDIGAHRRKRLEVRHLRQIADGCRWMAEHLAVLRLDQAGRDLQQRRLAGAVAADQRDAVAGQHRQRCAVEQRRAAESEADAVELEKWWCHGQKSDPAG